MESDVRNLKDQLDQIGHRWWVNEYFPQSIAWLAVGLVSNFMTIALAFVYLGDAVLYPKLLLGVSFGGIVGVWGVVSAVLYGRCKDPMFAARRLEGRLPELQSDITSALYFAEVLASNDSAQAQGVDPAFGRAHIRQTSRRLEDATEQGRLDFQFGGTHRGWLLPSTIASLGLIGTIMVATVSVSDLEQTLSDWLGPDQADTATDKTNHPVLQNLKIELDVPDYTGRRDRTLPNSSGDIQTVAGTNIRMTGRLKRMTDNPAMIQLYFKDQDRVVKGESIESGGVEFRFKAKEGGEYRFGVTDPTESKESIDYGPWHTLEVEPDRPPTVTVDAEEAMKIRLHEQIEIPYRVEDDYGLRAVERAFTLGKPSQTKPEEWQSEVLWRHSTGSGPALEREGTLKTTPAELGLVAKDIAHLVIRARDNNHETGPSVGASDPIRIEVVSEEQRHFRLLQEYKKLLDQWVHRLGDYLENPVGQWRFKNDRLRQVVDTIDGIESRDTLSKLSETQDKVHALLDATKQALEKSRKDPLSTERFVGVFEAFHAQTSAWVSRTDQLMKDVRPSRGIGMYRQLAEHLTEGISSLETNILRLEELLASERMSAIDATAQTLEQLNKELEKQIEKYKETGDKQLKEQIRAKINRMKQRMSDLMKRMRQQIQELPQEHMNMDAMKKRAMESKSQNMQGQLDQAEKKFKQGDLDGALDQLNKMRKGLSNLKNRIGKTASTSRSKSLKNFDRRVSKFRRDVSELKDRQKRVLDETEKMRAERREQQRREAKRQASKLRDQMSENMSQLREKFANEETDQKQQDKLAKHLESLDRALKKGDLGEGLESIEKLEKMAREMNSRNELRRRLLGNKDESDDQSDSKRLLEKTAEKYRKSIEKTIKRLENKSSAPRSLERKRREIAEAQKQLGERADKLKQRLEKLGEEYPMIENSMKQNMNSAGKEAKQAQRKLEEQKLRDAQDSEQKVIERLQKVQKQLKNLRNKRQNQRSGAAQRREKIEIPDKSTERKNHLRQKVLEALRKGGSEQMDRETRKYYKSLID